MPLHRHRQRSPAASRLRPVKAHVAVIWAILALVSQRRGCLHTHVFLPGIDKNRAMLKAFWQEFFRNIASRGVAPHIGVYGAVATGQAVPRSRSRATRRGLVYSFHTSGGTNVAPGKGGRYRRKPWRYYYRYSCISYASTLSGFFSSRTCAAPAIFLKLA